MEVDSERLGLNLTYVYIKSSVGKELKQRSRCNEELKCWQPSSVERAKGERGNGERGRRSEGVPKSGDRIGKGEG